ncbi:M14 family metallopeptidase [Neolewinella antarctica]|uniref:Peptidase M14 domain-containing protein n=1 Tax=Neolewinella antarctica TaxID=442734 RepID=A0ABX0XDN8_9BACT|nr:M14 family metallopeptidase [Neolewinella antarctica]NJC27327.1 hypothetical protein [Neolewinella antarctica]
MRSIPTLLLFLLSIGLFAQITHPSDFLPHRLGEAFTAHHQLVDYFEYVAEASPRVKLEEYGRTNERRPLVLAYVSSPENIARLEAIRENNLRAAGMLSGDSDPALEEVAIVWLSYSVHGNESAGSEASMEVLSRLTNTDDAQVSSWLENTVVIMDPSLNPDGYNRYTNWYGQISGRFPDTSPEAREHQEPWPGGRTNHYLFDLNRDWAWQTQVESQQRMVKYKQWMPHVHADIHEQGYTSPYYFAPAAAPFHEYITDWQGDFQTEIGKNHARYFDAEGWLYFTRERFDLLYPSYGDTYATFNGAIGMTYEQGGSGRAGRGIDLPNGDTLKLSDRIAHHAMTSMSTVEIASKESDRLTENFRKYFTDSANKPQGAYSTYVVSGKTPPGKMRRLRTLLDRNGIEYGRATSTQSGSMYAYRSGEVGDAKVNAGDLVISAFQPRSVLTQVLFDPSAVVEDSVTYDITSWSIPLAYGLEAYASTARLDVGAAPFAEETPQDPFGEQRTGNAYALVIPWTDVSSVATLAQLVKAGVRVRTADKDFTFGQQRFPAGSLVVTKADNEKNTPDYVELVKQTASRQGASVQILQTGFSTTGGDLGNGSYALVDDLKIAVLGGEGVNSNAFGQVWWYFERELEYPVSVFWPEDLDDLLAGDYDVIIMPDGSYELEGREEALVAWIRSGGKLIALGDANTSLSGLEDFNLKEKEVAEEATKKDTTVDERLLPYAGRERRFISTYNPGAVVKVELDATYPLSFGIGKNYFSLKTGADTYDYLDEGINAGRVRTAPNISGFVGVEAKDAIQETLIFGVQELGRGQVVYLIDNPLYRGFWEEGKVLFGNVLWQIK